MRTERRNRTLTARLSTELRLFVPGPAPVLSGGRLERRRDRYHVGSLTAERAYGRRGRDRNGVLEVLVARGPAVRVGGWAEACPEQWARMAVQRPGGRDGWIELDKEIRRADGLEVTSIGGDLGRWWSVALTLPPAGGPVLPAPLLGRLAEHRHEILWGSYPRWLVEAALEPGSGQWLPTVRYRVAPVPAGPPSPPVPALSGLPRRERRPPSPPSPAPVPAPVAVGLSPAMVSARRFTPRPARGDGGWKAVW